MHVLITIHTLVTTRVSKYYTHAPAIRTEAPKAVATPKDSNGCSIAGSDRDHGFLYLREKGKGNPASSTAGVDLCTHLLQ